jgi:hypothetical protein
MKKIISILIAAGILATAGTVIALASETDTTIPETTTTEAIPENTTEEVTERDEVTTENMEPSTDSDETTNSDDSTTDECTNDTTGETVEETEVVTDENLENSEAVENDSETVIDEYPEIPNTGTDRKIFPAIATFIVSGIALAYCLVKGKKNKLKKTKKDGE